MADEPEDTTMGGYLKSIRALAQIAMNEYEAGELRGLQNSLELIEADLDRCFKKLRDHFKGH